MAFKFGPKATEEPLKTEKPAELPDDETKEAPTPTEQMPHPTGPFYPPPGGISSAKDPSAKEATVTGYETLLKEMELRWKERTRDFGQQEDHLLIMKRAGRILNTLTWRHGIHMMAQKFSRILQEYENPGQVTPDKFTDACVDLANFALLTAEAHGRG